MRYSGKSTIPIALVLLLAPSTVASEPQESATQILAQADKLFRQENWEKARAHYQRALFCETDWNSPAAIQALHGAVECALKLDDWDEAWARTHHFRCYKPKHGDDRPQWSYRDSEKEKTQSEIKKLEGIRSLLPKLQAHLDANPAQATTERRQKLSEERIAAGFAIIETLVGAGAHGSYRNVIEPEVWWNTKDQEDWNSGPAADRWRSWWNRDRGVPSGADGKPQFVAMPPSYVSGLGTGEKVLFLLDEIDRLDTTAKKNFAARALLWRALIAERLYGPLTDGRWQKERYDYDWSARPYFRKILSSELSKPFWELADDEVRTTVDGRAQIIKLPEKENPLALLQLIESKFPGSDVIPEALYARGEYYQSRQQFDQALNAYGDLLKRYPKHGSAKDAAKQIENIFKPGVLLWSTAFNVAGEKPPLPFVCRRTNQIQFTAKRFDLAAYYRGEVDRAVTGSKTLFDSYGLAPDLTWVREKEEEDLEKYLKFEAYWSETVQDTDRVLKGMTHVPVTKPGAYLIEAQTTDGTATSKVMIVLTDFAIVHRQLRDKSLIYVADARTGLPVAGQEVYFYTRGNESKVDKLKTDKAGVIETVCKREGDLFIGAVSPSGGLAVTEIQPQYDRSSWSEREALSYAITDRPVYRPGSRVHFRLYLRHIADRQYLPPTANAPAHVSILGPQNQIVKTFDLRTDSFGGVSGDFELSQESALGEYSIQYGQERYGTHGGFRVESYKKPEFEVTVHSTKSVRPGEKARVRIEARYLFGGPVASGRVRYQIHRKDIPSNQAVPHEFDWLYGPGYADDSRSYAWLGEKGETESLTDEERHEDSELEEDEEGQGLLVRRGEGDLSLDGTIDIELATASDVNQRFTIAAEVRDASRRTVRGRGEVIVSKRELQANIELDRGWYKPEMQAAVILKTRSAAGTGVAVTGKLSVERVSYSGAAHEKTAFEAVRTHEVRTDANGQCVTRLPALPEGQYRVVLQIPDSHNQEVSCQVTFWVHGPKFVGKDYRLPVVEIIPDRLTYKIGDVAHVLVHTSQPKTRVLFSDDIREGWLEAHRFLDMSSHVSVIDIPIEDRHVPNFFIGATAVGNGRVASDTRELFVPPVRDLLTVHLETKKQNYRPGEKADIRLTLSDAASKPAAGQLTIGVYDKAISYIQEEVLSPPTVLLQQARLRRFVAFAGMQQDEKFRPSGQLLCPEFEIDGGRHMPGGLGGLPGGGGGTPDIQEQVAELVGPKLRDSSSRLRKSSSSGNDLEPAVRRDFSDTALWRAAVDVGADGTASVGFTFPESLTTWRFKAYALTTNTQSGEATAEVVTSKTLLVRLQTPRFLVEGDEVILSANVHNALKSEKRVTAEIIAPVALLQPADQTDAAASADSNGNMHLRTQAVVMAAGTHRFDWRCKILHAGAAMLTVKALTDEESDAMQISVPVLRQGRPIEEARSGSFQKDKAETQTFTITLPPKIDPSATELDLVVSPGPVGVMLDALPFLIQYPYGCTEQTMSRFYPTIIAAHALKKIGTDLEALGKRRRDNEKEKFADRFYGEAIPIFDSAEMGRTAQAGLERLYKFQHQDGGWGWWQHDASTPYMSAYVLMGLVSAEKAGLSVNRNAIEHAHWYLVNVLRNDPLLRSEQVTKEDWETQAFVAYVMSLESPSKSDRSGFFSDIPVDEIAGKHRQELLKHMERLGPYAKALLALAFHNAREPERARNVLHSLVGAVARDDQKGTAWLPSNNREYWHWWNSDVEATSWAVRALLHIEPNHDLIPRLVKWLVENRQGGRFWRSTRDTALAVAAIADFVALRKGEVADCRIEIHLDGKLAKTLTFTPDNFLTGDHRLKLDGQQLPPGEHTITLKTTGVGTLNYSSRLRYLPKENGFAARKQGIGLKRDYFRVSQDGSGTRLPLKDGDTVAVGDVLETILTVTTKDAYEYLAFEDPKPAGCEPVQVRSGTAWFGSNWATVELADDKVLFFVQSLQPGEHTFRYRLRAEVPGQFIALPANGFAMYNPEIRANSDAKRIRIVDPR